jgi:hypothetical protein
MTSGYYELNNRRKLFHILLNTTTTIIYKKKRTQGLAVGLAGKPPEFVKSLNNLPLQTKGQIRYVALRFGHVGIRWDPLI